jgi:hypothetical protein
MRWIVFAFDFWSGPVKKVPLRAVKARKPSTTRVRSARKKGPTVPTLRLVSSR